MPATYDLDGQPVDSLDLKCLLIGMGMRYPARVHAAVADRARLEPPSNPYACNCIILPSEVAVHLTVDDASPFALDIDDGRVCLFHKGTRLTEISFPPATNYYSQRTSEGRPFGAYAVLEGAGLLAFFYMWPCDYIRTQETCEFCFQTRAAMTGFDLPSPSDEEVAQIVDWAVQYAGVQDVQLTAGTKFIGRDECRRYARLLEVIDRRVGLDRIPSEIYCYVTVPSDPAATDQILEAGADRVAHDLHVWDRNLHARIAPGHCAARRPRRPTSGPGAHCRQVRPEPGIQRLRGGDRTAGFDARGGRVSCLAGHRAGDEPLDAPAGVDQRRARSAGPGLLPAGPPRVRPALSPARAQSARHPRGLARFSLPRHLSPQYYFALSSSTGTLILCCTSEAVWPRNRSPSKRCPCVLMATRSQPFSWTHFTICLAGGVP